MAYLTRTPTQIVGPFGGCAYGACSDIYPPEAAAPSPVPAPYFPAPPIAVSIPTIPGVPPSIPASELDLAPHRLPWWAWLAIGIVLARAFRRS